MQGYKVVLLGTHGVGKTTLINSMLGLEDSHPRPTIVSALSSFTHNGRAYYIWDTAGMEKYSQLNSIYLRGAHIAVYCESFLPGEHGPYLEKYAEELKDVSVINVLTKDDLLEDVMYERERKDFEYFERLHGRKYNYVVDCRSFESVMCVREEIIRRCSDVVLDDDLLKPKTANDSCC